MNSPAAETGREFGQDTHMTRAGRSSNASQRVLNAYLSVVPWLQVEAKQWR